MLFIEKLITKFKNQARFDLSSKPTLWVAAVLIAGFLAFYLDATKASAVADVHQPEAPEAASTFIPKGFVLVPIEVANFESLDSILGKHGVVDLYVPASEAHRKPIKVAERIRILRAPLNPGHFAVLTTEAESSMLVSHQGPFTVVVQPDGAVGTKLESPDAGEALPHRTRKARSRIEIEGV